MNILTALDDHDLFGGLIRQPATFAAWRAFLATLFAIQLSDDDLALYQRCTGRTTAPMEAFAAAWLVVGRRGGKSFVLALIAVFLAASRDYTPYLAPGERGTILIVATDRKQARTIMRYVKGALKRVQSLAEMIEGETVESIDLSNSVSIEVGTASFRTVRGYTIVAFLGDEAAYWAGEDSASPDVEIVNAIRPAMATIPNAMLLIASSPYARRGVLWDAYRRHHGKDGAPELVWQADTRTMNPTVPESFIAAAYEDDPIRAAAEYGAQFRRDVEGLLTQEAVDDAVVKRRHELPYVAGIRYVGFTDLAGGGADSMTLAIAHQDKAGCAVLDCIRERKPPCSPENVVIEFAKTLAVYNLHKVTGDRYAGEWPRERFRVHGVTYEVSEKTKNDLYRECVPLLNSGRIELLDHPCLIAQLVGLERRTARGGKDTIDHAPSAHDDIANSFAGAAVLAVGGAKPLVISDAVLAAGRRPPSPFSSFPGLRSRTFIGSGSEL